eukprot:TRINITY_DN32157_c0_g1_i1.p1 TRINITY_DN32157_c0_g1~~TRINITY_DN32157_c0_g1_i1.p1  ORF type:complete len:328 (-),score=54.62 TRINITY_DN32157_c0_g1_i1:21-1004(-)
MHVLMIRRVTLLCSLLCLIHTHLQTAVVAQDLPAQLDAYDEDALAAEDAEEKEKATNELALANKTTANASAKQFNASTLEQGSNTSVAVNSAEVETDDLQAPEEQVLEKETKEDYDTILSMRSPPQGVSPHAINILAQPRAFKGAQDDGGDDYYNFRDNFQGNFGGDFSVAFTVCFRDVRLNAPIIDFGNGQEKDNIIVGRRGKSDDLQFTIYHLQKENDELVATSRAVVAPNVLRIGETAKFLCQVDIHGRMRIVKDGVTVAERRDGYFPDQVVRLNLFVAKSNWPFDGAFYGELNDLRFWNIAVPWTSAFPEAGAKKALVRRVHR